MGVSSSNSCHTRCLKGDSYCCSDRSSARRQSRALSTCYVDFHKPAEATQQGGAQARLFRLVPAVGNGAGCRSSTGPEWLGKDVSSSFNEVDFYNEVLHLRRQQQQDPPLQPVLPKAGQKVEEEEVTSHWGIMDFMVSYHGLARSYPCSWTADGRERQRVTDLLVFRSPFEGLARPRMLHLELGPRSLALQARHENEVATGILARQEGIFLDGFLSPPNSIPSEGPTLDLRGWSWGDNVQRRAKRLPLQRLPLGQALSALLDMRAPIAEERLWPGEDCFVPRMAQGRPTADPFRQNFLGAAEYAELAMLAFVRQLAKLLRCCEEVPVPQKWVQSSLALLVEAGAAPPRKGPIHPETWVASRVKIQILGWSKSRLSLPGATEEECQDHELPWKIYQHHIGRVLWESSRLYFHTFCAEEWTELALQLYQVCHKGTSSLVGSCELKLPGAKVVSESYLMQLYRGDRPLFDNLAQPTQVSLTAKFVPCPMPSNFAGIWQVRLESLENLEAASSCTESLCMVLTASGSNLTLCQRTREVAKSPSTAWNEEFEFPVLPESPANSRACVRLLEALGQPAKAKAASFDCLAEHLPPLALAPDDAKKDVRGACLGQLAFTQRLRTGWYESRSGFE
ncbi:unnamed protein product [Effrenium voratum]|uniref:C2 domain-containing protein n=1 Tax=Effrenium voratum TaxID=2562239 RepID=A0AA36JRM4_9DINO|nr:unnamed protein product [Effrenium voratum]